MPAWLKQPKNRGREGEREAKSDQRHAESAEEVEARLLRMRERLAAESAEEREARLLWMRERLAVESAEESREARLHQMSSRQRQRLTSLCLMHVVLSIVYANNNINCTVYIDSINCNCSGSPPNVLHYH